MAVQIGFSSEYVVQDDFRVFLIWMQRFVDPTLLPNDLLANYFQSVTPWGYGMLYQLAASLGIPPLLLSKLLPIGLGLVMTGYCFALCLKILPIPIAGFISALLLNQSLWLKDDLLSAAPRAFLYPFLLAFLYYLLEGSWLLICLTIVLLGLFYPIGVLLAAGLLLLKLLIAIGASYQAKQLKPLALQALSWQNLSRQFLFNQFRSHRNLLIYITGLAVAVLVLLSYAFNESQFGPTVTLAEARTWQEFTPGGRIPFFDDAHPWNFWFKGSHSSLRLALNPPLVGAAFLLPLLMRYPSRFPLVKQIRNHVGILAQMVWVSLAWFLIAHALFCRLYLPSRYTQHSLRIVMALAGGIALTIVGDAILQKILKSSRSAILSKQNLLGISVMVLLGIMLLFYPNLFWKKYFPNDSYVFGEFPVLYTFLQHQPKDSVIASLTEETNNLPIFAQRSILASREYGDPYHVGYYRRFRERARDLIQAQYSPDLTELTRVIQKYKVSFWLLERSAFTPGYLKGNSWFSQYQPETAEAIARLEQGTQPRLVDEIDRCSVFQTGDLVLVEAKCIGKY
ncbi:MAG: hypothetical protein WCA35_13130 [Kovacikia sp.]